MEQRTKRLTATLGAIGIAAGLGLGAAGLASAATSPSTPASSESTNADQTGQDQDPTLNGSVQVTEHTGADEAGEAAALQSAAKLTSDQAKQAALAAVPGTVNKVELDNENGSIVYSVEISANGTTTDVKVDAGNGKVLAQESGKDDGKGETGPEGQNEKADTEQPDANGQAG